MLYVGTTANRVCIGDRPVLAMWQRLYFNLYTVVACRFYHKLFNGIEKSIPKMKKSNKKATFLAE